MADPTFTFVADRMQARRLEAHQARLAGQATVGRPSSIRVRLGSALIALGSTIVASVDTRQPSLAD